MYMHAFAYSDIILSCSGCIGNNEDSLRTIY